MRPSLVGVAFRRRWGPLLAATLATATLAGGVAVAGNALTAPRSQPVPTLRTVPAATLTRLGLHLSAQAQPPYCGVASGIPRPSWVPASTAGCAVTQQVADAAATGAGGLAVQESLLALVSSSPPSLVGRDRLTWLVVARRTGRLGAAFAGACPSRAGGFVPCAGGQPAGLGVLVMVDGQNGLVIAALPLGSPRSAFGRRPAASAA
jgi:hypothetical protein